MPATCVVNYLIALLTTYTFMLTKSKIDEREGSLFSTPVGTGHCRHSACIFRNMALEEQCYKRELGSLQL
jgi:hypothetical protein